MHLRIVFIVRARHRLHQHDAYDAGDLTVWVGPEQRQLQPAGSIHCCGMGCLTLLTEAKQLPERPNPKMLCTPVPYTCCPTNANEPVPSTHMANGPSLVLCTSNGPTGWLSAHKKPGQSAVGLEDHLHLSIGQHTYQHNATVGTPWRCQLTQRSGKLPQPAGSQRTCPGRTEREPPPPAAPPAGSAPARPGQGLPLMHTPALLASHMAVSPLHADLLLRCVFSALTARALQC